MTAPKPTPTTPCKPQTYYVVEVQFTRNNVPHRAILYTGFLNKDGSPGGYSALFNPTYEDRWASVESAHTIRVIEEIPAMSKEPISGK